jgi:phenylpropionate dioxygenase-like ring-hydroxylating dioxygenase large terminal subunit
MSYAAEVADDDRWEGARQDITDWYDTINGEDRMLLERLQRASSARLARPGPLLPEEAAIAEFHRYLERKLVPA